MRSEQIPKPSRSSPTSAPKMGSRSESPVDGSALAGRAFALAGTQHMFRVVGSPGISLDYHAFAAGIQIVGFDNELSAGYAAVDYGFLTGIPAVVVTTSVPGCIDGLAGLSCATANAWPFILLSTYGDRAESSWDELQEREREVARTAKAAFKVTTISKIPGLVFQAHAAAINRPGGCYLDIPSEVLHQSLPGSEAAAVFDAAAAADSAATGHFRQKPQDIRKAIVKAVSLLRHADRPLLVFETADLYGDEEAAEILKLVQAMGIPFLNTSTKPVVPDSHPLSVSSAKAARSLAIGQCDVALVFGGSRNRLPPSAEAPKWREDIKFVLVNVYEKDIMLRRQHVGIVAATKRVVELIYEEIKRKPIRLPRSFAEANKVSNEQLQKDITTWRRREASLRLRLRLRGLMMRLRGRQPHKPSGFADCIPNQTLGMDSSRRQLSKNGTGRLGNDSEEDGDSYPSDKLSKNGTGCWVNDSEGGNADSFPTDKVGWLRLPTDLMVNILERYPFKCTMKAYVAFGKDSSNVPYDRMKIPADTVPLLLHCGTSDETFMLYDPLNNIIFEIDSPKSINVLKLCDFSQRMLAITTIPDGVALVDMPTGEKKRWEIGTTPSDCYIIWTNGHVVKAVVGTKGSSYDTTIAILNRSKIEVKKFRTEVPFTVSPLTNPRSIGNKIFCLSTEGKLGVFNLENKVANIYEEEQEDNHEDSEEEGTDDEGSEGEGTDDEGSEDEDTEDEDSEDDEEEILNDFKTSAYFLCATPTGQEIFSIRVGERSKSVQIKKLQSDMKWQDINTMGDRAIFTGTRCSIVSIVPEELQNKVFLPGYYGSPPIVKAKLIESEGRFFFCPTSIGGMSNTSSPWFCVIGEDSNENSTNPVVLENSLWIQLNSFEAVKVKRNKS